MTPRGDRDLVLPAKRLDALLGEGQAAARVARGAFYDLAAKAFVIVMTSETRKYGNLLLKKGVTPP